MNLCREANKLKSSFLHKLLIQSISNFLDYVRGFETNMNEANYEKSYVDSEISIVNHTNKSLLAEIRGVVHESFPEEPSWYSKLSLDEYRSIVNSAQTKLNDKDFSRKIICYPSRFLANSIKVF